MKMKSEKLALVALIEFLSSFLIASHAFAQQAPDTKLVDKKFAKFSAGMSTYQGGGSNFFGKDLGIELFGVDTDARDWSYFHGKFTRSFGDQNVNNYKIVVGGGGMNRDGKGVNGGGIVVHQIANGNGGSTLTGIGLEMTSVADDALFSHWAVTLGGATAQFVKNPNVVQGGRGSGIGIDLEASKRILGNRLEIGVLSRIAAITDHKVNRDPIDLPATDPKVTRPAEVQQGTDLLTVLELEAKYHIDKRFDIFGKASVTNLTMKTLIENDPSRAVNYSARGARIAIGASYTP